MKEHTCKELDFCICSQLADEPSEDCPIHGHGLLPPRCMICGRFMSWKNDVDKALYFAAKNYNKKEK